MLRKSLVSLPVLVLGSLILITSVFRTSGIRYEFEPSPAPEVLVFDSRVDYELPQASFIMPDNPLWILVAGFDRATGFFQFGDAQKAEHYLYLADKRLATARQLFENGNSELGYSVLTKAEKYLEQAAQSEYQARLTGGDTSTFVEKLSLSSKKHEETIMHIHEYCPETAKPLVNLIANYSRRLQGELQPVLLSTKDPQVVTNTN